MSRSESILESATPKIVSDLKDKYGDYEFGNVNFEVYNNSNLCTVEFVLTFRRNNRVGAFAQYTSQINKANGILSEIAKEYSKYNPQLKLCTKQTAQEGDDWRENNGDDAYSDYEQAIGGMVSFKI